MAARFFFTQESFLRRRTLTFLHPILLILSVLVANSLLSAAETTDAVSDLQTEIVTEIVTVYEEDDLVTVPITTLDSVEDSITEEATPEPLTDSTRPTMVMRFTISNKDYSDIEDPMAREELSKLVVDELEALYYDNKKVESVTVLGFRNGSLIVDVQLELTGALNAEEREGVVATLYEKVVLNGTLGALEVEALKLVNDNGEVQNLNDACDIRPCLRKDMQCIADGLKCTASCVNNTDYCLNNSTCHPSNDYIICKCKKQFFGYRCDKTPKPPNGRRNDNAYIGVIAAAGIAVVLLLVMIVGCSYTRLMNRVKESDTSKLFSAENPVALEMLDEPPHVVGGVACQTIESFLLTKYMKHGVPPKPGFQHEIVQTNESFLLAKAQREREATTNNNPAPNTPNGTGASPPPALASTPVTSPEKDGKTVQEDKLSAEPEQGISNDAFVEDEGDIVPTAEVAKTEEAKTDIGKKIIKV